MKSKQKKILIPMDFDSVSLNTLQYVLKRYPYASISIVHVFSGLVNLKEPVSLVPATPREEALERSMKGWITDERNGQFPEQIKEVKIISGTPSRSIINYANEGAFHFIALGSKKKYDIIDLWFGATAINVIYKSSIPVLLVPKGALFTPGKSSPLIALEDLSIGRELLDTITNTVHESSHNHILHISSSSENSEIKKQELIKNLERVHPPFRYSIAVRDHVPIAEAILDEVQKNNSSEIIIFPENTRILSDLLNISISRKLIQLSENIPIWAFRKIISS